MFEIYISPKFDCNINLDNNNDYIAAIEIDIIGTITGGITGAITGTIVADSIPGPAVPG